MEYDFTDEHGTPLSLGEWVFVHEYGVPAEIIDQLDPDVGEDDCGSPRPIPPRVVVRFREGDEEALPLRQRGPDARFELEGCERSTPPTALGTVILGDPAHGIGYGLRSDQ